MAQSPWLVDQLQIEPGSTGTRLIDRDSSTGGLRFQDPEVTAVLSTLVGVRNITGVYVVGRAGDGAPYTSIQDAIDAIPSTSSQLLPSVVLVFPGVYSENIVLRRDGVSLIGLGGVRIVNDGVADTLTIKAATDSTPKIVELRNITLANDEDARACLLVDGSDTFATGTVTVNTSPLTVGDTLTIGGVNLVGVVGARTSGADNFSVSGGSPTAIAAEISAAINDEDNSFFGVVEATPSGAVASITAANAGTSGNSITLAVTVTAASLTVSGSVLAGGSAAGSEVLLTGLYAKDVDFAAEGAGGFQLSASTVNNIYVSGGSWSASSGASLSSFAQCSSVQLAGVQYIYDLEFAYDTGDSEPSLGAGTSFVSGVPAVGAVTTNFEGGGSFRFESCDALSLSATGDQDLYLVNTKMDSLAATGTVAVSLTNSVVYSVSTASGTPTLSRPKEQGLLSFAGDTAKAYTFGIPQPDTNYMVSLESPDNSVTLAVESKTAAGFTVSSSSALTGIVSLAILRNL